MNELMRFKRENKLRLQGLSFLLILMASLGVYFSVQAGSSFLTLTLMLLIALGMAISMWVS